MEPTLLLLLLVVTLALVAGVAVASRRRRDAALEPTRLGPSWTPTVDDGEEVVPAPDREQLDREVAGLSERTGVDRRHVETVLTVWREYLAVLGLERLPATHRYRLYDPYNPPVAKRDAEGRPTPDRERVARDLGTRTDVSERDAEVVLAALAGAPSPDRSDADTRSA